MCVLPEEILTGKAKPQGPASLEHINNCDLRPSNEGTVVLCCGSCNASKGTKNLLEWLDSDSCRKNKIGRNTIAPIVKSCLKARKARLRPF